MSGDATSSWRHVALALAFASAAAFSSRSALAAAPELHYRAPSSCPSSSEFSAFVAARTGSWLEPDSPLVVVVDIRTADGGFAGELTLSRAERRTERTLSAAHCDELARALALIVAILIDPRAAEQRLPAATQPAAAQATATAPAVPKPARAPWFVVGPEVVLETALTGDASVGERIFVGVGRGDATLWLSSLRLSASRISGNATSPESGARAEFELWTGRLDGCVVRAVAGVFAFEPCVFLEGGELRATGLHPAGNVTRLEPWVTTGVLLRPTVTLARHLVIGAGIGLHVPLTRYDFAFTGERAFYETAVLGFDGALGLGLRFP